MKKTISLLLAALMAAGITAGCGKKNANDSFTADNEIFTYQKIDRTKTQIVVSRTGNIDVEGICKAFEAKNTDVQVIYLDITGGNSDYLPLMDWITEGYAPDVVISATPFLSAQETPQYFENLSTNPIIQNYEASALKRVATEDDIYWLPGPSNISGMLYNKTLFAQYGWEMPKTFDEFVALCDRIRVDTNGTVEPWNPNAKYSNELLTVMEGFTYEELFGGVENRTWYNSFTEGKATFAGHIEPYIQVLQTLVEHKILRKEHFNYSATTRGKEFADGKIAMINANIYDADNDTYDFGYAPFPTTNGTQGYLSGSYSCYVGVPLKEHTEKQRAATDRFLAYFSSAEGQQKYIGKSIKASNVKDVPFTEGEDTAILQDVIEAGHMFKVLEFERDQGHEWSYCLYQCAIDITEGKETVASCIEKLDAQFADQTEPVPEKPPEVIATAEQDMTILETTFYMADTYRNATDANIALITNNHAYRGNLMRLFKGDITPGVITVLKPRSFANNSTLVKASMTGKQIMDALNNPVGNEETADCIYGYSGLVCEVAPWNTQGERYLSVKLANGSPLEPEELYTVAFWEGTVAEEYITEIRQTYPGTWEEIMTKRLRTDGTIKPANDGRIKLIWE